MKLLLQAKLYKIIQKSTQKITYSSIIIQIMMMYNIFLTFPLLAQTPKEDSLFKPSIEEVLKNQPEKSWKDIQITSASLIAEDASKAPAMIRVITQEQIQIRGYRSLQDLLKDLPELKFDEISHEQKNTNNGFRGVMGHDKFVILLDGVRVSPATNDEVPLLENYPLHYIKQVEVVYGTTSVVYGADALLGVINLITKTGNSEKPQFNFNLYGGQFMYRNASVWASVPLADDVRLNVAGSYHEENLADFSKYYDNFDKKSHETGVFKSIFGDISPTQPFEKTYQNPIKTFNIHASLKVKDFNFSFFRNYAQVSTSQSVTPDNAVYNNDVFYGSNITQASISYRKKIGNVSLNSLLSTNTYELNPQSNYRNVYVGMDKGYKYSYGTVTKLEQQAGWEISKNIKILGGITYENFSALPKTADLQNPMNTEKGSENFYLGTNINMKLFYLKYFNVGGFLQGQWEIMPNLHLSVGARYDKNSRFEGTLNPRASIFYQPAPNTFLKILAGSGFLAPSPETAFAHYGSFFFDNTQNTYRSFFFNLPNPNLKPIKTQNLEFGVKQRFGESFSVDLHSYLFQLDNLYLFVSDKDNQNLYNNQFLGYPIGYVQTVVNQDRQNNYGGTLQFNYLYNTENVNLEAYLACSYVMGELLSSKLGNIEAENITNLLIKSGVDLRIGRFSFAPRMIYTGEQKQSSLQKDNPTKREYLPSYFLFNAHLAYKVYKESSISVSAQNIFDNRYVAGSSLESTNPYKYFGIQQMPFRLQIGLQCSF